MRPRDGVKTRAATCPEKRQQDEGVKVKGQIGPHTWCLGCPLGPQYLEQSGDTPMEHVVLLLVKMESHPESSGLVQPRRWAGRGGGVLAMGHEPHMWVGGLHITQGQPHGRPQQPQGWTPGKTLNTRVWGMTPEGRHVFAWRRPGFHLWDKPYGSLRLARDEHRVSPENHQAWPFHPGSWASSSSHDGPAVNP